MEPLLGGEPRSLAHACEGRILRRDGARIKSEQELAGVRLPGGVPVPGDGAIAVCENPYARKRQVVRELAAERGPYAPHATRRDPGLKQTFRGSEEQELLKGEFGTAPGPGLRDDA